ncbi:hypothetical protein SEEPB585_17940 [Salmonella enterica subsp. enterica serovar Paratyphi B str. ATCC BAA-1585]|nr:hypothetical protein SEEPB585_17940 [Salmonella enterica subsp. enterica serovar Paratyphi B str. ATCC BAA-1585]
MPIAGLPPRVSDNPLGRRSNVRPGKVRPFPARGRLVPI